MSEISLNNIHKSFGNKKVLDNIGFNVSEGEMVSLLGPSGCGKTTLLKIIAGIIEPDRGDVILSGAVINDEPVEKRGTVIVFQDALLFPHMNVEQNIGFGLRMAKADKNYISSQVEKMLELVQLEGFEHKYPHQMSGGEKQRIALARALAVNPKVLLLDEPFSSLDEALRLNVRELTLSIQKKLGITTILVTHDHKEAMMLSDRIILMMDGEIIQQGTPQQIYKNPASAKAADFFGEKNYIKGSVRDGVFSGDFLNFRTVHEDSDNALAMIKPSDIIIKSLNKEQSQEKSRIRHQVQEDFIKSINEECCLDGSSEASSKWIQAVITESRFAGDKTYYTLMTKTAPSHILKAVSSERFDLSETVDVDFRYENMIIF